MANTKIRKIELESILDEIRQQVKNLRDEKIDEITDKLEATGELYAYQDKFVENITQGKFGKFMQKIFLKKGWKASGIEMHFRFFLQSELLPPKVEDCRAYAKTKGLDFDQLEAEFLMLDSEEA